MSGPAGPQERTGVWILPAQGGALQKIQDNAFGAVASPDDSRIAFFRRLNTELWLMDASGAEPRRLLSAERGYWFSTLAWSPDGGKIGYLRRSQKEDEFTIESLDLATGRITKILSDPGLRGFCWAKDNRIIYSRLETPPSETSANIWEVHVDPRTGKPQGTARRLTNWGGFLFSYLGISADSRRVAFVRWRWQSDVHLGQLGANGTRLSSPRRLTLDERIDWPGAWTRDSRTILFYSDRNGQMDIFRQSIESRTAEAVTSGPEEKRDPRLSPDGAWILFLTWSRAEGQSRQGRLMRMPVSGGAAQAVFGVRGYPGSARDATDASTILRAGVHPRIRCPAVSGAPCVLSEQEGENLIFSTFDPAQGDKKEFMRIAVDPVTMSFWDVSPDGRSIAFGVREEDGGHVRIFSLTGRTIREVFLKGWTHLESLAWAADGHGFFMTGWASNGVPLLRASLDGQTWLLYKGRFTIDDPSPSPDGRYLAFGEVTSDSNAWVVENPK